MPQATGSTRAIWAAATGAQTAYLPEQGPMAKKFEDPDALVPQELNAADSRTYEERTVEALRQAMTPATSGLIAIDAIELVGSRPDTLVVLRYHHRPEFVGRHPALVTGPRAEIARLWDYAIDSDDAPSQKLMDVPAVLAAAIGSAFTASELTLVDPDTLVPIGAPPNVYPRR